MANVNNKMSGSYHSEILNEVAWQLTSDIVPPIHLIMCKSTNKAILHCAWLADKIRIRHAGDHVISTKYAQTFCIDCVTSQKGVGVTACVTSLKGRS